MDDYNRGLVSSSIGETKYLEKSPFIQGFLAGLKGALIGAPTGAAVQVLRGKSPLLGAVIGGLGAGLVSGLARASAQKLENISSEESLRYHVEQMKAREPFVFMPPPASFGRLFTRMHSGEHNYAH
jgi:hypothetical protein